MNDSEERLGPEELSYLRGNDEGYRRGYAHAMRDRPALAAAEAAPLDVADRETLFNMFATERGMVVMTFDAFVERLREYAALRSPDTETAGEAG